ncbi:Deoxyribonuclease, TatD [Moelleriella libera RCEF 2490]|uniref:Deoxyribonuclease, TatD n=1 Tax=Moelleriella libera RCEF 2490 TaxID=1081109 RepID=A0A162IJ14_9HYPO|nr:Deoxyribonuclease, TatD [Moelleriella libera RCEF 2490]
MASIASFETMRASALTVMATRSQDQDLVAKVASQHGIGAREALLPRRRDGPAEHDQGAARTTAVARPGSCRVVPSFGWHPWFSHQLYDDITTSSSSAESTFVAAPTAAGETDQEAAQQQQQQQQHAAKKAHYQAVLSPPPHDDDFVALLPVPSPLSLFISATESKLRAHPVALVGEIGLDKAFRLPDDDRSRRDHPEATTTTTTTTRNEALTPGGREGRRLSPHRVAMRHQQAVLIAQLRLAGKLGKPVSVHGVQAHGVLFDTVSSCWKGHEKHVPSRREKRNVAPGAEEEEEEEEDEDEEATDNGEDSQRGPAGKPFPPRICLHSYSGPVEGLRQWLRPNIPATIYFSFSTAVNCGTESTSAKLDHVLRAVPADRILVESDLHVAGEAMDAALEDMYRRVCHVKGWGLEEGAGQIASNFESFIFGKRK